MPASLIVRAEVDPSVKGRFDAWYENEHLPDASEELLEVRLDRCVGVNHEDSFGDSAAVLPKRLQTHVCQTTKGQ